MSKFSVLSEIRKEFVSSFLDGGKRIDGRGNYDFRPINVETNVMENAEGSALVRMGTTEIIAGLKIEIAEPFQSEPDNSIFITNAELLPLASKLFEPGPPDERSIEFARVVDRGLRSAEVIDLNNNFGLTDGKVLGFFIDLYVLNYGGNLFDAGTLAASLALKSAKMPKIENNELIRGEYSGNLDVHNLPISTRFSKIGNHIILDPHLDEEMAEDVSLVINVTDEHVVAMQKRGTGSFKKSEVLNLVDIAFEKRKELKKYLE